MTTAAFSVAWALVFLISTAHAADESVFKTGDDLLPGLQETPTNNSFRNGTSTGYIVGVVDALQGKSFCIKPGTSVAQLRATVTNYFLANRWLLVSGATPVISRALAAAWPCRTSATATGESKWEELSKNKDGSMFVNTGSIRRSIGRTSIWVDYRLNVPEVHRGTGKPYQVQRSLYSFACDDGKNVILQSVWYESSDLTEIVAAEKGDLDTPANYIAVVPDSLAYLAMARACRK